MVENDSYSVSEYKLTYDVMMTLQQNVAFIKPGF